MRVCVFLFLIAMSLNLFCQTNLNIVFNKESEILMKNPESEIIDTLRTISANVNFLKGSFKLTIIDYNKNNNFNDFGNKYEFVSYLEKDSKKPDGLLISAINKSNAKVVYDGSINTLLHSTDFIYNGKLYSLKNILKNRIGEYTGEIVKNKSKQNCKKYWDDFYLNYADKMNKIKVKKINSNTKVNLKRLIKNKKTLIAYITSNLSLYSGNLHAVNSIKEYLPKNYEIVYVFTFSDESEIKKFAKINQLKNKIFYIDKNDFKSLVNVGTNILPVAVLYSRKGAIISQEYDIYKEKLVEYDK